jgi:hypothetical protein
VGGANERKKVQSLNLKPKKYYGTVLKTVWSIGGEEKTGF